MHIFRPHLGICGDACNSLVHLAKKIARRVFAVLKVPIDSEIEFGSSFGVKFDFSYASH